MLNIKHEKKNDLLIAANTTFIALLIVILFLLRVNLIVIFLLCSFLWLLFYGLIIKVKDISLSLLTSHSKYESNRMKTKKSYRVRMPKVVETETLEFKYKKPLIIKCPNCGMTLVNSLKKCPNCGSEVR